MKSLQVNNFKKLFYEMYIFRRLPGLSEKE